MAFDLTSVAASVCGNSAPVLPEPLPAVASQSRNTALVITDPQNDFLSPDGVTWSMVGENVNENGTVENLEKLLEAAKKNALPVFVWPHY